MHSTYTRRLFVASAAVALTSSSTPTFALYPFCQALRFANFGPPNMKVWADTLQAEVRKVIEWPDGLEFHEGTRLIPFDQAAKGLAAGAIDMAVISGPGMASVSPDFFVLSDPRIGPALERDKAQPLFAQLSSAAQKANCVLLGMTWSSDILSLTNPVFTSIGDLKGKRIRAAGVQNQAIVAQVGGAPQALPARDAIAALQQGLLDGAIFAPSVLESGGVQTMAIVNLPERVAPGQGFVMLVNRNIFDKADGRAKKAFFDSAPIATAAYRKAENEFRSRIVEQQQSRGAKSFSLGVQDMPAVTDQLFRALDEQYAKLQVSKETIDIVRSL